MKSLMTLVGVLTVALMTSARAEAAPRPVFPDLASAPLPAVAKLTKSYYQQAYPYLTKHDADVKWDNARSSPMNLLRAYVNTWYDEASLVGNVGPIGPCFGDPHVGNFGFLFFPGTDWSFTYNDFDDVGTCPVLFDALRFFTAVELAAKDPSVGEAVRANYIKSLGGDADGGHFSDSYRPDYGKLQAKLIRKSVDGDHLTTEAGDEAVSPKDRAALFAALTAVMGSQEFLDARRSIHTSGGSAGLSRYEVLMREDNGAMKIIELKEEVAPGSERGPWASGRHLDRPAFLDDLWQEQRPEDLSFVNWDGRNFLIRSLVKSDIDPADLGADEQIQLFTEEAAILAAIHKQTIDGTDDLNQWLKVSSRFMVNRYTKALQQN